LPLERNPRDAFLSSCYASWPGRRYHPNRPYYSTLSTIWTMEVLEDRSNKSAQDRRPIAGMLRPSPVCLSSRSAAQYMTLCPTVIKKHSCSYEAHLSACRTSSPLPQSLFRHRVGQIALKMLWPTTILFSTIKVRCVGAIQGIGTDSFTVFRIRERITSRCRIGKAQSPELAPVLFATRASR